MRKKTRLIPFLLSALMVGSCFASCTSLVSTNSEKDMVQIVASVDITKNDDFSEGKQYARYADAISSENVLKRDLVAYFINQGYSLVQNGGYSYSDAFDMMLDSLVGRKIVSQYAKVYFFENFGSEYTIDGYKKAVDSAADHSEIAGLKYFLSEEEYNVAVYRLKKIINNSIDSSEKSYVNLDDVTYTSTVRTLPTGVDTEVEDYYDPAYEIYTGKNDATACGSYEAIDGSTATTRKKAYNDFLSGLKNNYLLTVGEANLDNFEKFEYWYTELQSQLEATLINKLGKKVEEKAEKALTKEFVEGRYNDILANQQDRYEKSADEFETDLSSISDSSFVTYSPIGGYGFVYNILLPFSGTQSALYSTYQSKNLSVSELFNKRAEILADVKATDQRGSWMTGSTDYSFSASEKNVTAYGASDYIFFENNLLNSDRYEALDKYYGYYSYNGKVEIDEEDKDNHGYTLTPNKLSIDGFIDEMENYLAFAGLSASGAKKTTYMENVINSDNVVDYSSFLYYTGKVDVGEFNASNTFVKDTQAYKAMSVINDLMFAYNTDTAGLNSYLGYAVSAYDTQFVKEFEYAAKAAVAGGVGAYTVAPSDYGWHIMYCTYTFDEGEIYTFDWADIEKEGTFSYYFFESLKNSTSGNNKQVFQTEMVNRYKNDDCVKTYKDRYADYASLDKNS